jgi:23S rRNA pseudouridine1911/1915/1917 synthase
VGLVHRLDRGVGGVMVFAKRQDVAAKLSVAVAERRMTKQYLAVVHGSPAESEGIFQDLLYKDSAKGKSFVVDRERKGVKDASLEYKVLRRLEDPKRTLVAIELFTGRTHQIRVQFASRGLPLCGDRRYGAPAESGRILALASVLLEFYHPYTNEKMKFQIEPQNIKDCVDAKCP